ncbi:sialidase family protein [Larkinella soli]|uniref:sialidase family protein n=1 Tax=Larkinella soli TaxID=1770527 RepID=UPI000FFCC055|nr:sialidase family protein [Larkinella soli]
MKSFFRCLLALVLLGQASGLLRAKPIFADTTRSFAVPTLTNTPKGTVALSWTETDPAGQMAFYWAESADQGQTFGAKKLIFAGQGIGNSRLMRPKVLFRPDGSVMAVFALRGGQPAQADGHHEHGAAPARSENRGGGRPTDLQIVFCRSTDGGTTWSRPEPVHQDKTPNVVRGFFDAVVLANGEVGVAYLNDIPGRPHERDLRFVTSANGTFGAGQVLDPFVCDCCNISLLVDGKGTLHMYYRENTDNIRDIAHMSSTDHGRTFTKSAIFSVDNWKVNGCPHSGPTSSSGGGATVVAWYSGTNDAPGIRVADQAGKRLFVLEDASARNAWLVPTPTASVLLWEQNQMAESGPLSVIAYRSIQSSKPSATRTVDHSVNGTNATGLVSGGKLVVAYEVRNANNRNSMQVARIDL